MRTVVPIVLLFLASRALGQSPLGGPEDVARTFGYTGEDLVMNEITARMRAKHGDHIIGVYEYLSPNRAFIPVTVAIAREGTLLTSQLLEWFYNTLRQGATNGGVARNLETVELTPGVVAFVGLAALGPGAESWRAIATLPDKAIDIQISVTRPHDSDAFSVDESSTYAASIKDGGFWTERLSLAVRTAARDVPSRAGLPEAQALTRGKSQALNVTGTHEPAKSVSEPDAKAQPRPSMTTSSPARWLIGITIVVVLVGLLIWRRRSRE